MNILYSRIFVFDWVFIYIIRIVYPKSQRIYRIRLKIKFIAHRRPVSAATNRYLIKTAALLFFVPALFIRAKWLRGQNDICAFKHRARRIVAKDFDLHLHPRFTPARQTVEIAA